MKLRYTHQALADLDEITAYIAARSPQGARHVSERIQAVIDLILQHPKIGQTTSRPERFQEKWIPVFRRKRDNIGI